nr:carbonic anhydrase family protein [Lysinibacillus timonensis]
MSRVKYFSFLLFIQVVVAIFVYVSLSTIPTEQTNIEPRSTETQQVYQSIEQIGPTQRVSIDPFETTCTRGVAQSPININNANLLEEQLFNEITLNYVPTIYHLVNNGHTIQMMNPSNQNKLVLDGEEYKLAHVHFHNPSEHQIDGKYYNMEGHIVHEINSGELAIVSFFVTEGKVNTDLDEMWSILPAEVTEEPIVVNREIDLLEVLPENKNMYSYSGSITIPPCTEGVTWLIIEEPIEMSPQQIELFAAIYPQNNRSIQELNNRKVYKVN